MSETPTSDWSWINAAADRFEQAWEQGPRPRIEDYVAEVDEPRRVALLEELIRVEPELQLGLATSLSSRNTRLAFRACRADRSRFGPGPGRSTQSVSLYELPTLAPASTAGQTGGNGEPAPVSRVRYFGGLRSRARSPAAEWARLPGHPDQPQPAGGAEDDPRRPACR